MSLEKIHNISQNQIEEAGPRYTPTTDPSAPNLTIKDSLDAFGGLLYTQRYRDRVMSLRNDLLDSWENLPSSIQNRLKNRIHSPIRVEKLLSKISQTSPLKKEGLQGLPRSLSFLSRSIDTIISTLREKEENADNQSQKSEVRSKIRRVNNLDRSVNSILNYVNSPTFKSLLNNCLFMKGDGGTGKTHFLCDLATNRMRDGKLTLFFLAHELPEEMSPLKGICEVSNIAETPEELLNHLGAINYSETERCLIIIDGINEGNRQKWRKSLYKLSQRLSNYPNIGLALSCRTPFDKQILNQKSSANYVHFTHEGFSGIEFDAQISFFDHYNIPAPEYPLLTPEFSNPLFLKVFCKAISDLSARKKKEQFKKIFSGQKGMRYLFEFFVDEVGEDIEDKYNLPHGTCWRIFKGDVDNSSGQTVGIATAMSDNVRDFISKQQCVNIISLLTGLSASESSSFLEDMIGESLLTETAHWDSDKEEYVEVIQFPYQRFSDHLIALDLMNRHLSTDSEEAIKRSFYANKPLGKIFSFGVYVNKYKEPGIATALMLEFPERVKRKVPEEKRELISFLPKRCLRSRDAFKDVFISGLYWRNRNSFTQKTGEIVDYLLRNLDDWGKNEVFEALTSLATRPDHPYSETRIYDYLSKMDMAERDLLWSEYLRKITKHSVVFRILRWVKERDIENISENNIDNLIKLISAILTTTNRKLRDRATKALYSLGSVYPQKLFETTINSIEYDDIYLPERMLAASYGVAMSWWADPDGDELQNNLPTFAQELINKIFIPGAPYKTYHVLVQDYSLGIIDLAKKVVPDSFEFNNLTHTERPFSQIPAPFIDLESIDDEILDDAENAFHMDFENYTLGSLVPERSNYDMSNEEYQSVRKRVLWRVHDLGYKSETFKDIDNSISRRRPVGQSQSEGKIDRYGKKYSWIAFFEMYGLRKDAGLLEGAYFNHRTSDCDIDPSFPNPAPEWNPPIESIFDQATAEKPIDWLKSGPVPDYQHLLRQKTVDDSSDSWILLDGYVSEQSSGSRNSFTFIRTVLVSEEEAPIVKDSINHIPYPGNNRMVSSGEEYYTFAGEIPWSKHFGSYVRDAEGVAERDTREPFLHNPDVPDDISVEAPVYEYCWETYHSELNRSYFKCVAPALAESLGLVNHANTLDLYDSSGDISTIYREFNREENYFNSSVFYIREDLLKKYLEATNQKLVWIIWGERSLSTEKLRELREERMEMDQYANVYKKSIIYPD